MTIMPSDIDYQSLVFDYKRSSDQDASRPARHPVVIVGAGPVGLSVAIDLAQQGEQVVLLDDDDRLSNGSRAICFAKRTLEVFDRLGCGQPMVDKGVVWNLGKVFFRSEPVYSFNLLPEAGHQRPAFINLQQYYVEGYLLDRARQLPNLEIRWKNKIVGLSQDGKSVDLEVETPDGNYRLSCDWLVAADGARSAIRGFLGQTSSGQTFRDRFLIADVKMAADFPAERWFWFDPPFHPNQSVLLHQQPDGVWRIDFQLGWDADPVAERRPDKVIPRVQALLGRDAKFDLEWVSIYTFSCLRMEKFRLVLQGLSPEALLDTYDSERVQAADENILNSTRSTDFITPKNEASHYFRNATLELAKDCEFARRLVNSGRLSLPSTYSDSPLNTPDADSFSGPEIPGAPALDAPLRRAGADTWLLSHIGNVFAGIYFNDGRELSPELTKALRSLSDDRLRVSVSILERKGSPAREETGLKFFEDVEGLAAKRYDAQPGTFYLFRPDQHVCARWRHFDVASVRTALARATCQA